MSALFAQLDHGGVLHRDVTLPDRETGEPRQVDLWWEYPLFPEDQLRVLIDAKFRRRPIDVRAVESVLALGRAVGADKCVIVASNGWTEPAGQKASRWSVSLKLFTVPEAIDALDVSTWWLCESCRADAVVVGQISPPVVIEGAVLWWLGGRCWNCGDHAVECQECGTRLLIEEEWEETCGCGYQWRAGEDHLWWSPKESDDSWVPATRIPEDDAD